MICSIHSRRCFIISINNLDNRVFKDEGGIGSEKGRVNDENSSGFEPASDNGG